MYWLMLQDALVKSNDVFETFKQEIEKVFNAPPTNPTSFFLGIDLQMFYYCMIHLLKLLFYMCSSPLNSSKK